MLLLLCSIHNLRYSRFGAVYFGISVIPSYQLHSVTFISALDISSILWDNLWLSLGFQHVCFVDTALTKKICFHRFAKSIYKYQKLNKFHWFFFLFLLKAVSYCILLRFHVHYTLLNVVRVNSKHTKPPTFTEHYLTYRLGILEPWNDTSIDFGMPSVISRCVYDSNDVAIALNCNLHSVTEKNMLCGSTTDQNTVYLYIFIWQQW